MNSWWFHGPVALAHAHAGRRQQALRATSFLAGLRQLRVRRVGGLQTGPAGGAEPPRRRWPRQLRWFAAEFMVVLTGVLVALALNAWWGERQERQLERRYLLQLHEDLAASEADLSTAADEHMSRALQSARVGHAFWNPAGTPDSDLLPSLTTPLSSNRSRPVLSTAQALVATGDLRLIRSDRLRSELMSYLEWSGARIDNIARFDETYYRPAVALLNGRFDFSALQQLGDSVAGVRRDRSWHALRMNPGTTSVPPFPISLDSILKDAEVYRGYAQLLVGHRNQAFEYRRMVSRSRYLRGLVHQELHGVPDPGNCQLVFVADGVAGSCGSALRGLPPLRLELSIADAVATGLRDAGWEPFTVATGRALVDGLPATPVEIEVDGYGHGVIRTAFGWFEVRDQLVDPRGAVSFRITGDSEVPGTDLDAAIIRRARQLLDSATRWDRQDDGSCTLADGVLSLYCALQQATVEVTGGFHHRRPALQIVRAIVAELTDGRDYEHRLQDYNNDPRTSLHDIHAILEEAELRAGLQMRMSR